MFELQGIVIDSFELFHQYFDFQELYELIHSEDDYIFYEFCNNNLKELKTLVFQLNVLGTKRMDGSENKSTGLKRIVHNPKDYIEEVMWSGKKKVFRKSVADEIESLFYVELESIDSFCDIIMYQNQFMNNPDADKFRKHIKTAVMELTEDGNREFTIQAAEKFYVYLVLHALAGIIPDNPKSMENIKKDLDKLCPISAYAKKYETCFVLQPNSLGVAEVPFSYYSGTVDCGEPLVVIELKNETANPVIVKVKDTIIKRCVSPENSIYALRKGTQIVAFIPRFRLHNQIVSYLWNGQLCHAYRERRKIVETVVKNPINWVENNEYGIFIIDQSGNMDETRAWPKRKPEKAIVMVDSFASDYCLLFCDGETESIIRKDGWDQNKAIWVNLGLNASAIINEKRQVILGNGQLIDKMNAMDIKVYKEHFICLDEKGAILTDSNLNISETVYAIALCSRGYILAFRNSVKLYDYSNTQKKQWEILGVTEVAVDESQIIYINEINGEVRIQLD